MGREKKLLRERGDSDEGETDFDESVWSFLTDGEEGSTYPSPALIHNRNTCPLGGLQ